jgi:hypothetical protein
MPVDPAEPVVTAACFFVAGGPWVRSSPGIPCALFDIRGPSYLQTLGRERVAGPGACASIGVDVARSDSSERRALSAGLFGSRSQDGAQDGAIGCLNV